MFMLYLWYSCMSGMVSAGPHCTGRPRMLNGKRCASTTHYADGHKGACGCGNANGDSQFSWNKGGYVAAANQLFFSSSGKTWCGEKCGVCVKLTPTGTYIRTEQKQIIHFSITKTRPCKIEKIFSCKNENFTRKKR